MNEIPISLNGNNGVWLKANVFMNLQMSDSLYHYLHKITMDGRLMRRFNRLIIINGSLEIEPFRRDPRYIQFLKEYGFPEEAYAY